jgi:hypothetical protein
MPFVVGRISMYGLETIKKMNEERVQQYNVSNATLRIAKGISKDVKQSIDLKELV